MQAHWHILRFNAPKLTQLSGWGLVPAPVSWYTHIMQDDLNNLLKSWKPEIPEPTDFRRNVWLKIERARKPSNAFGTFIEWLGRPKIALATLSAAVALGAFVGMEISVSSQGNEYLRSVNPYALNR